MRRPPLLPLIALGLAVAVLPARGVAHPHARARPPTVVELFTAQGCADCLKADQAIADLAGRRGVILLTWPVDYWDYEGWTDTFAEPAFSERQRAYARRLKVREIYTPELVVDGAREASALDAPATVAGSAPRMRLSQGGARLRVAPGRGRAKPVRGDVWLVRYDPRPRAVKVKSGDNRGKTVVERNVVRELTRLGAYTGVARTYAVPQAKEPALRTVLLLQAPRGGRVLAVATDGG
jgi:hypothetical protein